MKAYSCSVMAFSQLHPSAPAGGTYVEHEPAFITAENIGAAAAQVEKFAFERWPIDQTWFGHNASIEPITDQFFMQCFGTVPPNIANDEPEEGQIFTFDR